MVKNYLIEGPVTADVVANLIAGMSVRTDLGGHSIFLGQVRADEVDGKTVRAIEYSAYESIVKAEAEAIIKTLLSEFQDVRSVDLVHSTGVVNAGEISLFILVSAGHRKHAIDACSKAVELVKERLPIWKKEIFTDSSHNWKQNNSY